jgi:DNA-binding beta-propeller fold protein YncE
VLRDSCQKRVTDGIEKVEAVKSNIDEQVRKANAEIEDAVSEAHRVLDERKSELLGLVKIKAKQKKEALNEQLHSLQGMNAQIDRVYRTVDSCLHSENLADITSAHRFMADKMQGVIRECESIEVIPVAVANIKTELGLSQAIRSSTKIEESSADPIKCSATINKARVGEEATVVVRTAYENGQPCIEPQEVVIQLHPEGKMDNIIVTATVNECSKQGEYLCVYTPNTRGWHLIHILVNKQEICNSPFELYVDMPPSQLKEVCRSIKLDLPYQVVLTSDNKMIVSQSVKPAKITVIDGDRHSEFCKREDYYPTGIAAAMGGSVYVAYDKPCIVKYSRHGDKVRETTESDLVFGVQQLKRPGRIELSKDEMYLYVCDRGNECVVIFNTSLDPIKIFTDQGRFSDISFAEEDDHVYVSDKNKNVILKYASNGQLLDRIGESILKAPRGILVHRGHLYVADRNNARISVFNSMGDHKLVATFGNFHDCGSLTMDRNGYIFVCDERSNKIYVS